MLHSLFCLLLSYGAFAQQQCGNLFPEGDFETGTCSTSSSLGSMAGYTCKTTCCNSSGTYMFTSNANNFNPVFSGTPHGGNNMMVVDSKTSGGVFFNSIRIDVQPGATYTVTAYVRNPVTVGTNLPDLPVITLQLLDDHFGNNNIIPLAISGPLPEVGSWVKLQADWTVPSTINHIHIQIATNANSGNGADFCLDDISLTAVPEAPTATSACVTRCGPGPLTLSVTGSCDYRWYTVPTGGTPLAGTGNQLNVNIPTSQTSKDYYVCAVNLHGVEGPRTKITAITDPIRTFVTTTTPVLGPSDIGSYTITVQNLDCSSSHNLTVNGQVTGPGTYSPSWATPSFGPQIIAAGQTITFNVGGSFSASGNYVYNALVSDGGCAANGLLPVNVAGGAFIIENYLDGICADEMAYFSPIENTHSNTFEILNEDMSTSPGLNTCSSTGGVACNMQVPATPGVYVVRNTAVANGHTFVTTKPLHVFGKDRRFMFDGQDDRITVNNLNGIYSNSIGNSPFTLEAWIRVQGGYPHGGAIVGLGEWQNDGLIFATTPGGTGLMLGLAGDRVFSDVFPSIYDDECHHVAVSYDRNDAYFYIDGREVGRVPINNNSITTGLDLWIGDDVTHEIMPWHGIIDEVRFWKEARSEEQINEAKSLRIPDNYTDLLGYWPLNDLNQGILDYSPVRIDGLLGASSNPEAEDPQLRDDLGCLDYCMDNPFRVSRPKTPDSVNKHKQPAFEVLLAPNPSSTESTLRISGNSAEKYQVRITNPAGQEVFQGEILTNDVLRIGRDLKPGLYYVQVFGASGNRALKFIKQ